MNFKINAEKVTEFRAAVDKLFPEWKALRQVQIVNIGGRIALDGVRGYRLSPEQIITIMELAETYIPEPAQPTWQPQRCNAPRYGSHARAASKLRMR